MKVLDKEAFFAAEDMPLEPVSLPEMYGEDVGWYVRTMTGVERSELEKQFMGKGAAMNNPGKFRAAILISCIVDADGKHVFDAADESMLMGKNAGTLETVFTKACEVNGFTAKDVEDIEGN